MEIAMIAGSILNLGYRYIRLKHVTETIIMEEQNGYHIAGPCTGIKQITEDTVYKHTWLSLFMTVIDKNKRTTPFGLSKQNCPSKHLANIHDYGLLGYDTM
jgi:hypothetical protein